MIQKPRITGKSKFGTAIMYIRLPAPVYRRALELAGSGPAPRSLAQWVRDLVAQAVSDQRGR